jgi:hypothetical protein
MMEGAVETRRVGNQPNLFQPAVQRVVLERAKLLPLLRSLLLEVVFGANTGSPTKESDHE